jgi:hypothetical protein
LRASTPLLALVRPPRSSRISPEDPTDTFRAFGVSVGAGDPGDGHLAERIAISGMTTTGSVVAGIPAGAATDDSGNPNTPSTSVDDNVTWL